jgi:hypothetical protein
MRVLWLYRYIASYDFDCWLHMKFAEVMAKTPGIEMMAYGPRLHKGYPGSTSLPYHPNATISDIRSHFPFDCIIMNTKSRMFQHYDPHRNESRDAGFQKAQNQ